MNRTVIWVLIAVLVLAGVGWFLASRSSSTTDDQSKTALPSGSNTDDAALEEDYAALEGSTEFSSDSAAIDSSLNDSQGEQSSL